MDQTREDQAAEDKTPAPEVAESRPPVRTPVVELFGSSTD